MKYFISRLDIIDWINSWSTIFIYGSSNYRLNREIVALRETLWTNWRATIRSVLKFVHFLRTKKHARFRVYISISIHNMPQNNVSKYISLLFSYLSNMWLNLFRAALKFPNLNFSLICNDIRDLDVWSYSTGQIYTL
jgi:hypothetical protein